MVEVNQSRNAETPVRRLVLQAGRRGKLAAGGSAGTGAENRRVEPGADAEAIFWDVKIEDSLAGGDFHLTMSHYIRIKIFTALGKEKYATVEIEQPRRRISLTSPDALLNLMAASSS